ncbi:hypothetical protein [uncultured Roseobacter sp.]|uniref:hypothetical protein n=1 Tax=uncultured Roseobacter sp. TaxID=114847 RepID=UPI0026216C3C|nr:hypothetical protein [uncultured Roseobacter sp.]
MFCDKTGNENPDRQQIAEFDLELERILNDLNGLPEQERGERAVIMAARLMEYAAFELAGHVDCELVGEMVNLSARMSGRRRKESTTPVSGSVVPLFPQAR